MTTWPPRELAFRAVLFDMDGTLSDTEPLWYESDTYIAETFGTGMVPHVGGEARGMTLEAVRHHLRENCGVALTDAEIWDEATRYVLRRLDEGVPWQPGARETLTELRRLGVPVALVTSSPGVAADAVIAGLPASTFDVVVSFDDVERAKPAPEPYLLAAGRLGVRAGECLAVEDSLNGARSAVDAGCVTYVLDGADQAGGDVLPMAARRIASLWDLPIG